MPLLAICGALLIGLSLGLLGSGGSILTVPALVFLVGQDEKVAIAGSLGIVGLVAFAGSLPRALRGQVVWASVLWFGAPSMAGAWLGAMLSAHVSGTTQLLLFGIVMLLAAALMLRPPKVAAAAPGRRPRPPWLVAIDGLLVGMLAGLVGVGGGFLIVPALVLLGGMEMRLAVGTSLLVIALQSASGFVEHLAVLRRHGLSLDWRVFAVFSSIGVLGAFAGVYIGGKLPQSALRRAFGVVLVGMAAFILWRTLVRGP